MWTHLGGLWSGQRCSNWKVCKLLEAPWRLEALSALGSVTSISRIPFIPPCNNLPVSEMSPCSWSSLPWHNSQGSQWSALLCTPLCSPRPLCLPNWVASSPAEMPCSSTSLVHAILSAWNVFALCSPGENVIIFQNPKPTAPWFFQVYISTPSWCPLACIYSNITCLVPIMCSVCYYEKMLDKEIVVGCGWCYFSEGIVDSISGQSLPVVRKWPCKDLGVGAVLAEGAAKGKSWG